MFWDYLWDENLLNEVFAINGTRFFYLYVTDFLEFLYSAYNIRILFLQVFICRNIKLKLFDKKFLDFNEIRHYKMIIGILDKY